MIELKQDTFSLISSGRQVSCYVATMAAFVFLNEKYKIIDRGVNLITTGQFTANNFG